MRKIISIILASTVFTVVNAQTEFTITGNLNEFKDTAWVVLQYVDGEKLLTDSALLKNGSFELRGQYHEIVKAKLTLKPLKGIQDTMTEKEYMERYEKEFFLDTGVIILTGTDKIGTASITGGEAQRDYRILLDQLLPFEQEMKQVQLRMHKVEDSLNNKEKYEWLFYKDYFPKLMDLRQKMNITELSFFYQHPNSYVSLYFALGKAHAINPNTYEPFFRTLSERMRQTSVGRQISQKIALAKSVDVGRNAIDISGNTPEGHAVSLSSLRGKYVLVDFWASWCKPCRKENPNILKTYNKYKNKNFEVLAFTLDVNTDEWLKAIKEDGMPWIHVCDIQSKSTSKEKKSAESPAAKAYGITSIPQNILVNPQGKIVGRNLRGENLEKFLETCIKL